MPTKSRDGLAPRRKLCADPTSRPGVSHNLIALLACARSEAEPLLATRLNATLNRGCDDNATKQVQQND